MSNIIDKIQVSGVTYDIGGGGGGKAIEAGRGISITTGETADTVSFNLPISAGTGSYSIIEGSFTTASGNTSHAEGDRTKANGSYSHAEGLGTKANGEGCHAEGTFTTASGNTSHAEGSYTKANGIYSHTEGLNTVTNNKSEHASGQYNNSVSASTTFGDSGNTLFSVGNGTGDNARHNAFEIRQNGDIYLSSGGTDIKLQDHLGGGGGGGNPTVELTQAEYDALVTAGTVAEDTYYIITDAQAGDLTQYWTSAQTQSAITQATSGLQETLVSGTNIKTINNESLLGSGNIDIQGGGGGKAIEAGRGIAITTGETADTVSFNLPISAGTGNYSIIEGESTSAMSMADHAEGSMTYANGGSYSSHAEGYQTSATSYYCHSEGRGTKATSEGCHAEGKQTEASGEISHAEGEGTKAMAQRSHSEGAYTTASSVTNVSGIQMYQGYQSRHAEGCLTFANNGCTHTEGYYTQANNFGEHASGVYNVSNSATTTYGDSGNTLFSVGNGTSTSARHNAFEIRQNGDMYLNNGTSDIKLQDYLQIKVVKLTQSAYDALSPNYDSNTLYIIKD